MYHIVTGVLAGLSGCVYPVLMAMIAKAREGLIPRLQFVLGFFFSQFVVMSLLNMGILFLYEMKGVLTLLASFIALFAAHSIYTGKEVIRISGGVWGLVATPCVVGFAAAGAALTHDWESALMNALLFSTGLSLPLLIAALIPVERVYTKYYRLFEKISVVALVLLSVYLAYLAGTLL